MKLLRSILSLTLVVVFWIVLILPKPAYDNPLTGILATLDYYLPGGAVPGCSFAYYSGEYAECFVHALPGTKMVSVTVSGVSGQIVNTFVTLETPIRVGDLVMYYGDYELVVNRLGHWMWDFGEVRAYKFSAYGYPSKLTEVWMVSWR